MEITLNDLPKYSPWPKRILGLEPWNSKTRTSDENKREYELEKWGELLRKVNNSTGQISVTLAEEWELGPPKPLLCFFRNQYQLLTHIEQTALYCSLVEESILPYLPAKQIVELGSGYGRIIINLAKKATLAPCRFAAGEFSESGKTLSKKLSQFENVDLQTGWCDFLSPDLTNLDIAEGAIIFTSFATVAVPELQSFFIEKLISLKPKIVIHFEPFYEHTVGNQLVDLMRKRYIEINDYNRNLLSLLYEQQRLGKISITQETKHIFGGNPLLPCSVVAWKVV